MTNPFEVLQMQLSEVQQMLQQLLTQVQPPVPDDSKIITRKDAAKMLGVSLPTLDGLIKKGTVKAFRLEGRVLLKQGDIEGSLTQIRTK